MDEVRRYLDRLAAGRETTGGSPQRRDEGHAAGL
jgi:hypothetical protein